MFIPQTAALAQRANRLLKPRAILQRLRLIRLEIAAQELREAWRTARALALIERYFPDQLADHGPGDHWTDTFRRFLGYVDDAGWFEIDWPTLDDLYQMAQQMGYEEGVEPDGLSYLAEYLWAIPCRYFNLNDEWGENWEAHPPLALLAQLLGKIELQIDLLCDYELYDNDLPYDFEIRQNLEQAAAGASEPLCWLKEIVEFVEARTGIDLLDRPPMATWDWESESLPQWDDEGDLDYVRQMWEQAWPRMEHIRAFLDWAEGPEQMQQLVELAIGVKQEWQETTEK